MHNFINLSTKNGIGSLKNYLIEGRRDEYFHAMLSSLASAAQKEQEEAKQKLADEEK